MPLSPDIQAVLDRRLATEPAAGTAAGESPADAARLLELMGFNAERVGRRAENAIVAALATGFDRDMLAALMQAYARGLGRIVAAAADAVRKVLKTRAPEERAEALEEAGQAATAGHAVWAVKYVGDGVFFVGRSAQAVTEASARAVAVLEDATPLRARAGIASGSVVRRAGDYFGPPVNLAQRLTTLAEPGVLLVAEPAAARLDGAVSVSERRRVEVRGVDAPVDVGVVRA